MFKNVKPLPISPVFVKNPSSGFSTPLLKLENITRIN